jgi:hydrogenase maturation protease
MKSGAIEWSEMSKRATPTILVIGCGNTLRRDDALGCLIAEEVDRWARPGVRSIALAQLTPELASELACATTAIFVDARADCASGEVKIEPLEPALQGSAAMIHAITPQFLLGLSRAAFRRSPISWLVSVPAVDFSFGEGLSARAEQGMRNALRAIDELINRTSLAEPDSVPPFRSGVIPLHPPTGPGPRP